MQPPHHRALTAAMLGLAACSAAILLLTVTAVAQDDSTPDFDSDALADDEADPFAAEDDAAFERAADERVQDATGDREGSVEGGQGSAPRAEEKQTPGPAALLVPGALAAVALALRRRA